MNFRAGSFVLSNRDELVFASDQGVIIYKDNKIIKTIEVPQFNLANCNMNDGKCDKYGNFVFGSMDRLEKRGNSSLYRINKEQKIETLFSGIVISNGPAFSVDGKTMYFSDSFNKKILKFNYKPDRKFDDNYSIFYKFQLEDGTPDGLCVDSQDRVWVALWGGKKVIAINREGKKVSEVKVQAENVTSCTFGGPSFNKLYITTARKNLSNPNNLAGGLFISKIETKGLLADRYIF